MSDIITIRDPGIIAAEINMSSKLSTSVTPEIEICRRTPIERACFFSCSFPFSITYASTIFGKAYASVDQSMTS